MNLEPSVKIAKRILWIQPDDGSDRAGLIMEVAIAEGEEHLESMFVPSNAPTIAVKGDKPINPEDPDGIYNGCYVVVKNKKNKKDEIVFDIDEAKQQHMDICRICRNHKLKELDNETVIALGKNDQKELKLVEAKKNKLRTMPDRLEKSLKKSKTLTEIRRVIPPEIIGAPPIGPHDRPNIPKAKRV